MKHTTLFTISLFALLGASGAHAATNTHAYANAITAHNITSIQHTITQTAISSFAGSMRGNMGAQKQRTKSISAQRNENPATTYGRAPMYGTAPMYGEYNDDGSAGRNGGDIYNADAALNSIWLNWQHMGDDAVFDNFAHLDSNINTFMFGVAGGLSEFAGGLSKWGMYAGFIDGDQQNNEIQIDSQGGHFGIYNGNVFGNWGLFATVDGGVLNNTTDTIFGTDEHSNFWVGAATEITYDFALDGTFTLQPGVHLGYTWIRGEDYTSASGDILKNDAFSMFEVTPTLRAIKHIANGWFGALNAKYVMIFDNGGDTYINDIVTDALETDNYREYSISLEKYVNHFNISAHFGRRDGARNGWIGGMNIKYAF